MGLGLLTLVSSWRRSRALAVAFGMSVVLVSAGCGTGRPPAVKAAKVPYTSATVKRCLEQHGVSIDSTGKKFPLPLPASTASQLVSRLQILEFTLPAGPQRPTDKVALMFYDNPAAADAAMKRLLVREAAIVQQQPAADRSKLRALLKGSTEQRQNVTISWANFGGTRHSERLVAGCLGPR
jgi:hypothetical protein